MRNLLLATLLIATLAGCTAPEAFDPIAAPEWQAGHAFAYTLETTMAADASVHVNGELQADDHGDDHSGPEPFMAYEVLTSDGGFGDHSFYLATAQIDAAFEEMVGTLTSGLAIRHDDLLALPLSLDPAAVPPIGEDQHYLNFPLEAGKTWSYDMSNPAVGDELVGDYHIRAEVLGTSTVETASGSVSAIHVRSHATFPEMGALIDEAEQEFEDAGFEDVSIQIDVDLRVDTYYAPEVRNVAYEISTTRVDMQLRFKDGSDTYDLRSKAEVVAEVVLSGADLSAATDLGQAGALDAIASGRLPRDPSGTVTLADGDVIVTIRASDNEVNAADAPEVTFELSAEGVTPEMEVTYELRNGAGQTVASGTGTQFSHTFTEPGIHQAIARVMPKDAEGGLVHAIASIPVIADYHGTVAVTCGPADLAAMPSCEAATVPLRPGIQDASITVAAKTAGAVGLPGTLRYTQSESTTSTSTTDGDATLELDGFHGATADGSATWTPAVAGAVETVTFTLDLDYGAPAATEATTTPDVHDMLADLFDLAGLELPL